MSQAQEQFKESETDATWLNRLPIVAGCFALLLVIGYVFTFQKLPANENSAAWGNRLREIAEDGLDSRSFGNKWAEITIISTSFEELHAD